MSDYLELKETYAKIGALEEELANSNKFAQDQENKIKLMENVITGLQQEAEFNAEYIHNCMADYNGLLDDYKILYGKYNQLLNEE